MELLGNRMIVLRNGQQTKTDSGIFLPEQSQKKRITGKVVYIGEDVEETYFEKQVLFDPIAGEKFPIDGVEHLLLFKSDIRAIL